MLEFISTLNQRYQIIQSEFAEESTQWNAFQSCIQQLTLIESFLHKGKLIEQNRNALNIAVIGPTQSGKSTIVNLLLDQQAAGVSPLAGFTVHPQGFAVAVSDVVIAGVVEHLTGFHKVEQFSLSAEHYNSYSISPVSTDILPPCLLWDTPDFDSIDAHHYHQGVLKTLGLTDVLILVVSKEKYADQVVWDTLALLTDLNQPLLVVINKLVEGSQAMIVDSFRERWQQICPEKTPDIMPLLFTKTGITEDRQRELIRLLQHNINRVNLKKHDTAALAYMKSHWQNWLAPVKAEQEAQLQWQQILDKTIRKACADYQRDYLNHPHHYDTFQSAMAELLTLLEVPGMAKVIARSRKVLAWPLRKAFSMGTKKNTQAFPATMETVVLQQISEHVFLQLGDQLLDQIELSQGNNKWWKALNTQLRQEKASLLKQFELGTAEYHENFKQEIEQTAQSLYLKLAEQPAVLNGLRATRVTTDAALLALTVQAGGIGLHDLLLAPAMLAVTSYLAESAVGSYLQRAEVKLKQQQFSTVQQRLFTQILQQPLLNLPAKIMCNTYFNISASELAAAEAQLEEKKHGLRIL